MDKRGCTGTKTDVGTLNHVCEITPLLEQAGRELLEQTQPRVEPKASAEALPLLNFTSTLCFLEAECDC